jgi:mono/diheme cytochrome c family protein
MTSRRRQKSAMRLVFSIALTLSGATLIGSCVFARAAFPPDIAADAITVTATPERLERGQYLVENVAACFACHGVRDWDLMAGPVKDGTAGAGGEIWDVKVGFPGVLPASNITPAKLSSWSDGEILRALVNGVSKDGSALFPIMPYGHYAKLAREDLYAIIAYLRTIPSVENTLPERKIDQPLAFILRAFPKEVTLREIAPRVGDADYPAYVADAAACVSCHTPVDDRGRNLEGMEYAGGRVFPLPGGGSVRSANLTPDAETGIGQWTRDMFIARMKSMPRESAEKVSVPTGSFNTPMAWTHYAEMTDDDLGALFDHLRAVAPVNKRFERFIPAGPAAPAVR